MSHARESRLALKRKNIVRCPICDKDIRQGENSIQNVERFLQNHQARSKDCQEIYKRRHVQIQDETIQNHEHENYEPEEDDDEEEPELYIADVTDTDIHAEPHPEKRNFIIGPVQLEESRDELVGMDVYKLRASDELLKIQEEKIRLFDDGEFKSNFDSMRTSKDQKNRKKWEDILDLYALGTELHLSDAQATNMLQTSLKIIERNGCSTDITIPKTWASIAIRFKKSKKKYTTLFEEKTFEYLMPEEYFGRFELDGVTPLKKLRGLALDVKAVLAEELLDLDPSQLSFGYRRDDDVLEGFETSELFRKICEDDELFEAHPDFGKPISLCITVRTDATTCNTARTEKEQAAVISILNAKVPHYKMLFLGYVPIHKPYSDHILDDLLAKKGM